MERKKIDKKGLIPIISSGLIVIFIFLGEMYNSPTLTTLAYFFVILTGIIGIILWIMSKKEIKQGTRLQNNAQTASIQTLKEKYARGEITTEQFREKKSKIPLTKEKPKDNSLLIFGGIALAIIIIVNLSALISVLTSSSEGYVDWAMAVVLFILMNIALIVFFAVIWGIHTISRKNYKISIPIIIILIILIISYSLPALTICGFNIVQMQEGEICCGGTICDRSEECSENECISLVKITSEEATKIVEEKYAPFIGDGYLDRYKSITLGKPRFLTDWNGQPFWEIRVVAEKYSFYGENNEIIFEHIKTEYINPVLNKKTCKEGECSEYEECKENYCISLLTVSKQEAIDQAKEEHSDYIGVGRNQYPDLSVENAEIIESNGVMKWKIELSGEKSGDYGGSSSITGLTSFIETAYINPELNKNETIDNETETINENTNEFDCSQCKVFIPYDPITNPNNPSGSYSCNKTTDCELNCKGTTWSACDSISGTCCILK